MPVFERLLKACPLHAKEILLGFWHALVAGPQIIDHKTKQN
jgi:hypothetical protein